MTKYKEYFEKMLAENKELFDEFKKIHAQYTLDPDRLQDQFNLQGEKILEVIREYENRLCADTERGMYNKFSVALAEKFQNEVQYHFPMIDHIGLIVEKDQPAYEESFSIKKIDLS
ncbi:hypothetical protein A2715_02085 [Candidatus Woesebacteria bacterium RIFCSPHIGHO2_01_FULL_39_32]|uniref:Uncharacterized protein n=2 Tax=Candidatus Woeseibacteriota TaxID=1752722 RepID=A0A0G0PS93_9BACT|nr:MAG: hypothetical protein UT61_C0002G0022 [Candidatus Woesebacteria bacterium GW2011_GWA1_39_8]OGM03447.1 MAG: hypothetical protein A2124_02320 [Candidatus Woesebacteria bacterium GWB1_37_5]OGM23944.1 MAG: hypothetical protein A2715_02085 [Candidatus Woesebacteria bacterium RIFCSPHIGHO2_01_FULL_39_32]OGM37450.1 MAG: hypothetical protein A3F01_03320 [Candidatus Woesebacteria bacterium RIFCSPHIGHO2_12_FULL_38_11]OGM64133.1 MAG: hypothetical protein A2893_03325 [Candidatus Woesebacteria bacteri